MASKFPNKIILLFTVILHTAKLNSQPAIGSSPPEPNKDLQNYCWSYLEQKPICLLQIAGSLFDGEFKGISPACCNATADVSKACWPILFPLHPLTPQLREIACGHSGGLVVPTDNQFVLEGAGLLPYQQSEKYGCLSGIESCFSGLYKAIIWEDIKYLTKGCCKAILGIPYYDCWSTVFPFATLLPYQLGSACTIR